MNPSTAAAVAIVDALVDAGVREIVLCPGSRSAPIAYAVRSAERAGRLRLHVRVDERSAGFLALGLGKRTGVPAVVVTTSGTAVANLHPAVLEAHHARVPLIVLSADRPAELRGSGANQTTTQPGIFAGALRAEADLAPLSWPDSAPDTMPIATTVEGRLVRQDMEPVVDTDDEWARDQGAARLRSSVAALVNAAGGTALSFPGVGAGPVHLNIQFREPLVPDVEDSALAVVGVDDAMTPNALPTVPTPPRESSHSTYVETWLSAQSGATSAYGWFGSASDGFDDGQGGRDAVPALVLPERTLVIMGDLPRVGQAEVALGWAARHRLPVVAEPFGPHPRGGVVQHGVLALGDQEFVDAHEPDCVVIVGRPTLSRPVSALVRRPRMRRVIIESGLDWSVPERESERVPSSVLTDLSARGDSRATRPVDRDWAGAWFERGAEIEASLVVEPPQWPSGAAIARTLGAALPAGALLFVGSSNAPRDLDIALGPRAQTLDIVASRGLAGIDGCVSTAVGLALAEPERPAYALMGDLTFLHDANGLLIGPTEPRPNLTVVVVNDDGGGIFHVLEPGSPERAADFERLFGTPTGTDLAALCAAHGIRHSQVHTAEAFAKTVAAQPSGISVVEIDADRSSRRADAAELRTR